MIGFRHPLVLLLLLLVPLLVWLRHTRRRRAAVTYSNGAALAALPRSPWLAFQSLPPALFGIGLAFLVLAAARPQKGMSESRVETEGVDIVLLIDTSTSMRAEDFSTATRRLDRLDAAKSVVSRFIESRRDDRIGIVIFAAMPYTIAPLTTDHAWLLLQLDRIQTGMLEDRTAIGDALASAVNRLRESSAQSKVIILLTDGIQNAGQLSTVDAAQAAAALGIKVYVVGAASDQPQGRGFFNLSAFGPEIDDAALKKIADITGAKYFRATDLKSLETIYREIDEMEKTKIELDQYTRYEEIFAPFLLVGLLALLVETALGMTRLGRLP
ncbi:MAG: VWA domain-containing protein [Verrucomicrobiota bacterium]|jgi:Ca-activated chloride channel family protein|nr:VWA domain-containing protein [Verrucomicrobiota bacterium]